MVIVGSKLRLMVLTRLDFKLGHEECHCRHAIMDFGQELPSRSPRQDAAGVAAEGVSSNLLVAAHATPESSS